jgi:hypothetical protein
MISFCASLELHISLMLLCTDFLISHLHQLWEIVELQCVRTYLETLH